MKWVRFIKVPSVDIINWNKYDNCISQKIRSLHRVLLKTDLLLVTEEERNQIMKLYNVDDVQIKKYIEIIKEWKSKLPHLPGDLNDDFIEKLLLKNKYSLQKTKQKLENYYTIRGINRHLIEGYDELVPSKQSPIFVSMPKITPTFERVVIVMTTDLKCYDLIQTSKSGLAFSELLLQYDGSVGLRIIADYKGFTLKHLATWNPILILKYISIAEKAYSVRIAGMEFINFSSFANQIFWILKLALKPKIYERIRLHPDLDSLHKAVPKECLPVEYGGSGGNIPDLLEKLDDEIGKHKCFLNECLKKMALEDLRPAGIEESDLFGAGGTFKKLSID